MGGRPFHRKHRYSSFPFCRSPQLNPPPTTHWRGGCRRHQWCTCGHIRSPSTQGPFRPALTVVGATGHAPHGLQRRKEKKKWKVDVDVEKEESKGEGEGEGEGEGGVWRHSVRGCYHSECQVSSVSGVLRVSGLSVINSLNSLQ